MKPIYVFGHRNPDNDSIVSAVAYATLKNILDPDNTYIPARLGSIPRETQWIFDTYGIEIPQQISHIHTRVGDVMETEVVSVTAQTDMQEAGGLMRVRNLRALPVLEEDKRVQGLLTQRTLALRYLQEIGGRDCDDDRVSRATHIPQVADLMETALEFTSPDRLLDEAAEDLLNSPDRELIVADEEGCCVGMLTRTDIVRGGKRRCILVDHNELSQSAPGVQEASVLEIVDHHRIGDVQTAGPIPFYNMPIGSTASIVALRYQESGVEIPPPIAAILLSAILTDTIILKSPTTTDIDRRLATALAAIADLDYQRFGIEILKSRESGERFDAHEVLTRDLKEYRSHDLSLAIAQYETVNRASFQSHRADILTEMQRLAKLREYDALILMVTDIVEAGSEICAVGKTEMVQRTLDIDLSGGSAWMSGVLSRKKQIAAPFME